MAAQGTETLGPLRRASRVEGIAARETALVEGAGAHDAALAASSRHPLSGGGLHRGLPSERALGLRWSGKRA